MNPSEPQRAPSEGYRHKCHWFRRLLDSLVHLPGVYQVTSLLSAVRFVVEGESMQPCLASQEYLLVSRLSYRFSPPSRGDIVVVRDHSSPPGHYIKRIVALPGEHVCMEKGEVLIDGHPLEELYAQGRDNAPTPFPNQWLLDREQYFVLGDNRQDSRDSRSFGPAERSQIIGRAWLVYFPPGRWRRLW